MPGTYPNRIQRRDNPIHVTAESALLTTSAFVMTILTIVILFFAFANRAI